MNESIKGLTTVQAQEAARLGQSNIGVDNTAKTTGQIVRENVLSYFNLIFAVLAVLVIAAGSYKNLTFLVVVIANTVIGIVQQLRAKKILDDLKVMNQPACPTYRDGQLVNLSTTKLVPNDVIVLHEGTQIPADAVVISGEISVNESLLTGEADEIEKKEGAQLMSGSFVVNGECEARLTRVGLNSYINQISMKAKQMEGGEQSEMVRSINRFVIMAGIAIVPIGVILYYQAYKAGYSFSESVPGVVAAVIGMIPEGLYLLVSVTLVLSAVRLAMSKVMLHDMKSTETLARVDVLCVDKTGTITENRMEVVNVVAPRFGAPQSVPAPVHTAQTMKYDPETGKPLVPVTPTTAETQDIQVQAVTTTAIGATRTSADRNALEYAGVVMSSYLAALPDDNATMRALREYFPIRNKKRPLDQLPFSSKRKYSAVTFDDGTYMLGAPDILLGNRYDSYREQIESYAHEGLRVIVLGRVQAGNMPTRDLQTSSLQASALLNREALDVGVEPIVFILLHNPLRAGAKETFAYFGKQGVEIRVISGDNPVTVSEVAMRAGIPNATKYIDTSKLKTKEEMRAAVKDTVVFGRVTPEMKQEIINTLKDEGHTVAMTGDGVNDILAMKDADCSIAMAAGSDAAVQAAQVVLLDSDFSKMPGIVAEGRRDINNIERSATLFLVKNIFSFLLSVYTIMRVGKYPLEPTQISLVSMFNIGLPAFLLAIEPNNRRIAGHFMRRVLLKSMPAAITDFIIIAAMVAFGNTFGVVHEDISVASTYLLAIVGFMILYRISAPMNRFRVVVMVVCVIGLGIFSLVFSELYAVSMISRKCFMLFVVFALITEPFMRYLTILFEKMEQGIELLDQKVKGRKQI